MEDDPEFEVTAEMLVHQDVDDEATLEEEEASTKPEDVQEELAGLEQEGDMPLEQLLALYGCAANGYHGGVIQREEEEEGGECNTQGSLLGPAEDDAAVLLSTVGGSPPISPPGGHMYNDPPGDHLLDTSPVEYPNPSCSLPTACKDADSPHPAPTEWVEPHVEGVGLPLSLELPPPSCDAEVVSDGGMGGTELELLGQGKLALPAPGAGGEGPQVFSEDATPGGGAQNAEVLPLPHKRGRPRREESKYRLRPEVPERRSTRLMQNEAAAVEAYFASVLDGGSDDEENSSTEDWKREVKVGPEHQAEVAGQPTHSSYSNDTFGDKVIWKPDGIDESEVSRYLAKVAEHLTGHPPPTTNPHDDERALEILQQFHHDTQHALKWIKTKGFPEGTVPWTEEECKRFETGLRSVGKDFNALSKQFNTRTFKELVEFYYVWKKTEGYSSSAQQGRLTRKKVTLQPGCASMDFMERLLDLQDRGDDSDLLYATSSVAVEAKKDS